MSKNPSLPLCCATSWFLVMALLLGGCATMSVSRGRLERRLAVEHLFESGTILEDYTYYTDGSPNNPDAIIALSNAYRLQSGIWIRRDWDASELSQVVNWMQIEEIGLCSTDGGILVAPDGREIGVWYSKKNLSIIREPSPFVVQVYPFRYTFPSPCRRQERHDAL